MRFVDYLARADRDEVQNLFYQFFEQDDRNDDYCVTERSFDNMYDHLLAMKNTIEENDWTILLYPFKILNDVWIDDYFVQYGASLISFKELQVTTQNLNYDEIFDMIEAEKNKGYKYMEELKRFPRSQYSLKMEFVAMPQIYKWTEIPSTLVAGMRLFEDIENKELVNLICAAVLYSTTVWGCRADEPMGGGSHLKNFRSTCYELEKDMAKCDYLKYLYRTIGCMNGEFPQKPEFPFAIETTGDF